MPTAVALLVLALALGRLLAPGDTDAGVATPTASAGGPVFPEPTGTVLFLDDGTGAVGLDLDTGATEQLELAGRTAGDRSYRLWRLGPQLVVGQEGGVVVGPGVDGATRTLGRATRFLPAADPQQLWLLDGTAAGGPDSREATGVWTLVATSGRVVASIEPIPGYEAVRGLPRGLAFRDGTGRLWRYDIVEDVLVEAVGGVGPGWIGDVVRSQVAWCSEDPCRTLDVADAGGADPVGIGGGETFSEGHVWLSPAGDHVAAVVRVPATDGAGVEPRLRVYRTATGEVLADASVPLGRTAGSWTVDGRQFFGWIQAVGAGPDAPAIVLRWAGTDVEVADARSVGAADVQRLVAVPRSAAGAEFGNAPRP